MNASLGVRRRIPFLSELAFVAGIMLLAFGTALTERADFGMSMVVSPAYILHLRVSRALPWFTFGRSEVVFQTALLLFMFVMYRKFEPSYLFSFLTAFVYGMLLDLSIMSMVFFSVSSVYWRILWFFVGIFLSALGISLLFRTYFPPEVYELFVKELARKKRFSVARVKTCYDCASLAVSVLMSFAFFGFGQFRGIGWGTVVCALANGALIGLCTRATDSLFEFRDAFSLRSMFER